MRKHRSMVSIAIACVLMLSGLAVACTPVVTPASGSPASPEGTPGQKASPITSIQRGHPVDATADQAINDLGLNRYSNLYAGGRIQPDGSVTIYIGPGDDSAFVNALHALLTSSKVRALGPVPQTRIVRVPHSEDDFTAARVAFQKALPQLAALGYVQGGGTPNPTAGTYDVTFTAAPNGMTAAAVTSYLQKSVSPLIRVTTVREPLMEEYSNRGHDSTPYYAGDLIKNPNNPGLPGTFCTTGFTVIGTLQYPRATTAGHCGKVTGNEYYTNGKYTITAPSKTQNSVAYDDGSQPKNLGQTASDDTYVYQPYSGFADIQFLRVPGGGYTEYAPYVWVGEGTSQPTGLPVGDPYATYPMPGTTLAGITMDGAFSRMVRHVMVIDAGPNTCFPGNGICGMIKLYGHSQDGTYPVAQPGDSGGPVFCYACHPNGHVQPAGLIEGGPKNKPDSNMPVYATFIGNDLAAIPGSYIMTAP